MHHNELISGLKSLEQSVIVVRDSENYGCQSWIFYTQRKLSDSKTEQTLLGVVMLDVFFELRKHFNGPLEGQFIQTQQKKVIAFHLLLQVLQKFSLLLKS